MPPEIDPDSPHTIPNTARRHLQSIAAWLAVCRSSFGGDVAMMSQCESFWAGHNARAAIRHSPWPEAFGVG